MAVDQALVARVRDAMTQQALQRGLTPREMHMFGGLAFMLNDKMACGVVDEELMVRVGPAAYADALAHEHVRPMDFTGKPMRGYVFINPAGCHSATTVNFWIERAAIVVEALTEASPTPVT